MAYLLTHFWPGGTEDEYRATVAEVHPPNGLPEGQSYHAAGPTDGGFLIASIWDSKDASDRFVSEVLLAKGPIAGGLVGPPKERGAQVANFETS